MRDKEKERTKEKARKIKDQGSKTEKINKI
jgi:hypothetical protein